MFITTQIWTSKFRASEDPLFTVNDSNVIPNLGKIDAVFVDKTGTMTTRKSEIINILVNNKIFMFSTTTKRVTSSNLNKYSTYFKNLQKEESMKLDEKSSTRAQGQEAINKDSSSLDRLNEQIGGPIKKDTIDDLSLMNIIFPDEDNLSKFYFE